MSKRPGDTLPAPASKARNTEGEHSTFAPAPPVLEFVDEAELPAAETLKSLNGNIHKVVMRNYPDGITTFELSEFLKILREHCKFIEPQQGWRKEGMEIHNMVVSARANADYKRLMLLSALSCAFS